MGSLLPAGSTHRTCSLLVCIYWTDTTVPFIIFNFWRWLSITRSTRALFQGFKRNMVSSSQEELHQEYLFVWYPACFTLVILNGTPEIYAFLPATATFSICSSHVAAIAFSEMCAASRASSSPTTFSTACTALSASLLSSKTGECQHGTRCKCRKVTY